VGQRVTEINEAERLAALHALEILDTQPEAIFDNLTRLAGLTFQAPVALVTLIDANRQWFKACVGLPPGLCETTRDVSFCDYTIRKDEVLVVPDARADPRFSDNPLVTGDPWVRFYAGAPLITAEGHRLGSLCVIDFEPRAPLSATDCAKLEAMASAVATAMAMRRDLSAYLELQQQLQGADDKLRANEARLKFLTENSADLILRIAPSSEITWASPSSRRYGYEFEELLGDKGYALVHPEDLPRLLSRTQARMSSPTDLQTLNREFRVRQKSGDWIWFEENPSVVRDASGKAIEIINVLREITDRKRAESAAADIQSGMLLARATLANISPKVEVDAVLQPARTIGGDLYDAFMLDDDRLCFLLGDVTGKGVPASLFMALAKALSHSILSRDWDDLGHALRAIDAELARNNGEAMAISMLVGVLELESGRLHLCNAGQDDPMILKADGAVEDLTLDGGPALCVVDGYPYVTETRQLPPGATLILVTDGVTEAQTPAGDLFGRARARDALRAASGDGALTAVIDSLVVAVRDFEAQGEPSDDLAALSVRRR
jgi:PAS domain S-box-containing protein